ncbi:MAG: hypothetical protein C0622_07875 [Desulfuromonas sp.]|nr:MAG: hypothetical protein C0622_07875 [Desulfuromonas sp.]
MLSSRNEVKELSLGLVIILLVFVWLAFDIYRTDVFSQWMNAPTVFWAESKPIILLFLGSFAGLIYQVIKLTIAIKRQSPYRKINSDEK